MADRMKAWWVSGDGRWGPGITVHAPTRNKARYFGNCEMDFDPQEYDLVGAWRMPAQDTTEPICPKCGKNMRVFSEHKVMVCRHCYGADPDAEPVEVW